MTDVLFSAGDFRRRALSQSGSPVEDAWQTGELIHGSPTGEEWLVKNRFGQYWVSVTRLRPATEPQPDH